MLAGSIVALVTPMDEQGRIDVGAFKRLLDLHCGNGTSAVVVAGTTGESPAIEKSEFQHLLSTAVSHLDGAIPVVAGTGSADTAKTTEMTRLAAELGADAALVVTPYYNRPPQAGLRAHFESVADAVEIPVVLYNVPARTGVDLSLETVIALAAHENIVGIKEALADIDKIKQLVEGCPGNFAILSGDDGSCCEAMFNGADGVISVAANVVPGKFSALCRYATSGDTQNATQLNDELRELNAALALESNPIPVKWMLHEMGLIGTGIRLPLVPLDAGHHERARSSLARLHLI
ncbi:MAG: 4-hydroxy-tetrahydrodipicolinate synthase [Xanthomonadales bacterium]|nr:4-hydroxy-tetrahydrodipicolinate synthase [Xanthomonadales bacterium]NNL95486.1 4-hydroxy-tetrahydrodipicolinate synthase [Xanthomonadales bacterium]